MNQNKRFFDFRQNYTLGGLNIDQVLPDALEQFNQWLEQAMFAKIPEPNAMTLATATPQGKVSSRVVLLKEIDDKGLVFYTNYNSRKAAEISLNPMAALSFLWLELERQVRIEGILEKISPEKSDEYFASRPRENQIGAWSSDQSTEIASREELSRRFAELEEKYKGKSIPRPPYWGGYRLLAESVEFWQGGPGRIHDRILYTRTSAGWQRKRLAP